MTTQSHDNLPHVLIPLTFSPITLLKDDSHSSRSGLDSGTILISDIGLEGIFYPHFSMYSAPLLHAWPDVFLQQVIIIIVALSVKVLQMLCALFYFIF